MENIFFVYPSWPKNSKISSNQTIDWGEVRTSIHSSPHFFCEFWGENPHFFQCEEWGEVPHFFPEDEGKNCSSVFLNFLWKLFWNLKPLTKILVFLRRFQITATYLPKRLSATKIFFLFLAFLYILLLEIKYIRVLIF